MTDYEGVDVNDRSPYTRQRRCDMEYCNRAAWTERRLDVCGFHAREIMDAMRPEVEERAKVIAAADLAEVEHLLAAQQRRINALESQSTASKTPVPTDGTIYFLRVGGYIKIGWTSDLAKRMRAYSPDTILLATHPGTRKDEHRLHKMFAAHRTHGREWYAMTPSIMHHIEQVASEHGTPDPVTFAARPVEIPQSRQVEAVTPRGWTGRRVS